MFARAALLISVIQVALLLGGAEARIWLLEREGRAIFARRFGQAQPAVLKEIASACGGGVCDALADEAVAPLLAGQPECSQQDMADKIIDASRQFDAVTQVRMIAAAVRYRETEKNTPPDFSTYPPTLRNSVFCQKAPKHSVLSGLVQAQDPANDPNLFYDSATKTTVIRGSQSNTFPFQANAVVPGDQSRLFSRSMRDGNDRNSGDDSGDNMGGGNRDGNSSDNDEGGNMNGGNNKNGLGRKHRPQGNLKNDGGDRGNNRESDDPSGDCENNDSDNQDGLNGNNGTNVDDGSNNNNGTNLDDGSNNNGTNLDDGSNIDNGTNLVDGSNNNGTDLVDGSDNNNGTNLDDGSNNNNGTDLVDGGNNETNLVDGSNNNTAPDLNEICKNFNNGVNLDNGNNNNNGTDVIDGNDGNNGNNNNGTVDAGNIGNFGSCSVPEIQFAAGFDGRRETSFEPVDKVSYNHGSAQNIGIITQFICDQLVNTCKADETAKSTCANAKLAAAAAPPKTGKQADAFNAVFGKVTNFASVTPLDDQGNPVAITARSLRRGLLNVLRRVESYLEDA